ncbi:hypothetical protein FRC02_004696 [Tulasnella sp. 418]|nr:hypothetical protein FRC02_004696 [Tulasnella sp. 418]
MSKSKFEVAVEIVQGLPKEGPIQPTQDQKLTFYSRYKQATVGDVNTSRPGLLDFVGKAKWDAWKAVEGKSKEEAEKEYVDALLDILNAAATDEAAVFIKQIEEAA